MKTPTNPPSIKEEDLQEVIEYLSKEEVKQYVKKVNNDYLPWDELRYKQLPIGVELKKLWAAVKITRGGSAERLMNFSNLGMEFQYNTTLSKNLQRDLHMLDMECGGILGISSTIAKEDQTSYLVSSIMEEAIASSQLEGATTSRKIAKQMLKTERKPSNRSEKMILNNYKTINKVRELKSMPLTPELVKDIQATITQNTLENREWEGRFRDNDEVRIHSKRTGEVLPHMPPEYEKVPLLIKEYCDFANAPEPYIHPVVKASILHFLIGYIHPFEDGNGRTARAIFYWYLLSTGYWLVEYMSISRIIIKAPAQYARAYLYCEGDENDMTYFIIFQVEAMQKAMKELKEYIQRKIGEKKKFLDFLKIPHVNERQAYLLSNFANNPQEVVTISYVQKNSGVTYQTARTDLLGLVARGFLSKKVTGKKFLFFRSPDFEERLTQK